MHDVLARIVVCVLKKCVWEGMKTTISLSVQETRQGFGRARGPNHTKHKVDGFGTSGTHSNTAGRVGKYTTAIRGWQPKKCN